MNLMNLVGFYEVARASLRGRKNTSRPTERCEIIVNALERAALHAAGCSVADEGKRSPGHETNRA